MTLFLVYFAYFSLRKFIFIGANIDKFSFATYFQSILVLPETVSKFFIPLYIKVLPSNDAFNSITGGVIFLLLLAVPLFSKAIDKKRYYFGFLWFIIFLIPELFLGLWSRMDFFIGTAILYLPSLGILFIVAELVKLFLSNSNYKFVLSLIIAYLLILGSVTL